MKTLYKALMASAAALAISTASAKAADPFAGLYIGAHAGYNLSNIDLSVASLSWNTSGTAIGIHGGYGWRVSNMLYAGIEADWSILNSSGDTLGITAAFDWSASLRGRIGIPIGNAMPYLTAGVAWTRGGMDAGVVSGAKTEKGFVYGGGVDFAITNNWIARAEYLRVDYGNVGGIPIPGVNFEADSHTVRGAISYKFN